MNTSEYEKVDNVFDFGWQNMDEPCIRFDYDTLTSLRENPLYKQIFTVLRRCPNQKYNHIFIDWELLAAFVVFVFENATINDLQKELEKLSNELNYIVDESECVGFVRDFEFMFYDLLINEFLSTVREINAKKQLEQK